jgi:hypothetical protein
MAFIDNMDGSVTDTVSTLTWKKAPSNTKLLWDEAAADAPSGWRLPTLDEIQSLLKGQKEDLAGCAAAFGEENLPTDWFWVYKIDPAYAAKWQSTLGKTPELAEEWSVEKPGHVAAYFVWMGRQPANNRRIEARCRYVQYFVG